MVKIKSFSVGNGDMFYIRHNSSNFTIIDCNLNIDRREAIMNEICMDADGKDIRRFISTHPDEDHFHGIEYLDSRNPIINFYCVKNKAIKDIETDSFKKYCELRDGNKAYYLYQGCSRKWMNENGPDDNGKEIGSAGINILWPDTDNQEFKDALANVNLGKESNNISPIIKYSQQNGIDVLWFGDMEHDFMDLIKEALSMGFANAAIMDTKELVFVPEYRQFCEDNLCGNYNLVPACPPACGTVEEMHEKALKYEKALVLQTILKDPVMDPVLFKQAKHAQNILTEQLARQMQEAGKEDILIMSAGPYKNCSCMSAYSVDAQKMADAVGMVCWADDSDVRFFTQILFHKD